MSLSNEPSFRLIAPFLRPVMGLLDDESVSEVMVCGLIVLLPA